MTVWTYRDLHPRAASLRDDVLRGLSERRKTLPPKYFYDARGSALFERICELPEYYPTRTEMRIMRAAAGEMAALLGPRCALVEYGSGSGQKTRVLLDALKPLAYLPVDIAATQLKATAEAVAAAFPAVRVIAVCADYTQPIDGTLLDDLSAQRRVIYFSGSTIGNFTPGEATSFLERARALVGHDGGMLIGVDLEKDERVLHAAYNDRAGVTAQFNLNLLERLNRELDADFDLSAWRHHAFYNADLGRIEMHLVSARPQSATVSGVRFDFDAGETIHTENSYKYTISGFHALAESAGFRARACWTDGAGYFSVHYLVAR
jgi:dimethylhistidine N-methyltransferase